MLQRLSRTMTTSIRNKVAFTTLLTVSIVLACVSGTLFFYFHNLLRTSIFTQQSVMVSEIAEQLNGRIRLARYQLSLAATEITSQVLADPGKLQQFFIHASPAKMIFDAGLLVIGTDGRVIAESMDNPALVGADLQFRDYVNVPLQNGKPYISAPFRLSLPPHTPMIAMVVPVRDNHDRIICLLAGYHSLGVNQFLTSLSSEGLGSTGYLYILDGRTILSHPDSKRILETIAAGKNRGIDQALKGMEGSLDNVNSRGQRILSSFKRVGETGWILAANIPYADAFAPLNQLALNAALIAAAGILFSLLVIWYVTRRVTRPIEQLIAHVEGAGRPGVEWKPLELKTGDELERLAQAFNCMMDEVRQAGEAVEQSARIHRIVAEYTSEIAVWVTLDGAIRFISTNCFAITGYRDVEFYINPGLLDEVIHPDDRRLWRRHRDNYDENDTHAPFQIRFLCKDGVTKWMTHACHLVRGEGGEVTGIRGSFSDITDTMLAQQRLHDEKVFVENLINNASMPMFVIDSRHTVLYWNQALESITVKSRREMKGTDRHWSGFYETQRPTMADMVIDGETRMDKSLYSTYSPSKYVDGGFQAEGWFNIGGKRRYLLFEAAPIRNSEGRVVAAVETLEDITGRRQMEESLARLTRAVEQSPASIVMTDLAGTIEYVNPKFCQTTGYTVEEAVGQNPRVLKSGEMSADNYATVWKTISSGKEWRGEFHNKRKDGSLYWEFASISPLLDKDGCITGYLAVKEDITERKKVEMELQEAYTKLKEAQMQIFHQEKMASIGQLAAGVAHEINNPIGFINSNLSTLNKYIERLEEFIGVGDRALQGCRCDADGAGKLAEVRTRLKIDHIKGDAHQLIHESQDGTERIRRIVQDLRSFSRVDHSSQELIKLNEALETTINIAWNEIKYVATLNREYGDVPEILCFPHQLNQVFLNLLVNAGHAMEGMQGSITIRTWCEDGNVFVSIADTGCGIPAEIRKRIFEPFFTTKEVGKGTGLGLSISYDIIRKHGGEITLESEAGRGSTFTVRLPVARSAPQPEST